MRTLTKRAACLVLAAAMVGSLVGCSKKSDKKTDDVVAAAESVMDALISRSSKKLAKAGDFSDETIAAIDEFGGSDAISAVMKKASYEVDKDGVKEEKKGYSVPVEVKIPNVTDALNISDADESAFEEAIEDQKESDYEKVKLSLKFKEEDDEFTLTNGDDVALDLYSDDFSNVIEVMGQKRTVTTDTEPTDPTDPTETKPVDPTEPPTTTTEAPTPTPTEPPKTASSSAEYDVIVFQDDKTVIHFNKVASDGVHFTVDNLTDHEVTIQMESLAIDGVSIMDFTMSDKVAAGSSAEVITDCAIPVNEKVGTVSGRISVVDFDTYSNTYDAMFDTTVIDDTVTVEAPSSSGALVYEGESIQIYYVELCKEGVAFDVVNLTALDLHDNVNSVAINGRNLPYPEWYSKDIAPHSVARIVAKVEVDPSEVVGMVSGQFEFADPDETIETFRATFDSVAVDANVTVTPPELTGTGIYEDEIVRIAFKELSEDGPIMCLQNLTEVDAIIQAESLSVNRRGIYNVYLSVHMAPHSTCEVVAEGEVDASQAVGMVSGGFIIANPDNRKGNYMVHVDNVVIDASVTVDAKPEGTLIYEDSNIRIYYKELREKCAAFDVENLTPYNITIQDRDFLINGVEPDGNPIMSDDVAPNSVCEIRESCKPDTSMTVTSVTFTFAVFSWDDKVEHYEISGTDVAIG